MWLFLRAVVSALYNHTLAWRARWRSRMKNPEPKSEEEAEKEARLHFRRRTSWDRVLGDYMTDPLPKRIWRKVAPLPGVIKIKVESRWDQFKRWVRK